MKPLRLLMCEDREADALLLQRALEVAGYQILGERVDSARGLESALARQPWDAIVSDYAMPGFGGLQALAILKKSGLDIPFIIVSGTIGEETAVEALKAGAQDFLVKGRLARLAHALEREMTEAAARRHRRQAEAALEQTQRKLERTLASSPCIVFVLSVKGEQLLPAWVSDNVETMFGYTAAEALAAGWWLEGIHPEDRDAVVARLALLMQQGHDVREYRFRHRDGSYRWVRDEQRLYHDRMGVLEVVSSWADVTDQRRAEQAMRRLAAIVESSDDAIIALRLDRTVETWNPGAERLYGYSADHMMGQPIDLVIPEERRAELAALMDRIIKGEHVPTYETMGRRSDGQMLNTQLNLSPIRDRAGNVTGTSAAVRDMSERKRLQEQLLHAQKMEAVGRLAGGVAHDFNNMLSVILAYGEMLLPRFPEESQDRADMEEILRAARQSAMLTRQLLAFARRQVIEPRVLNLNRLVQETEKLLRRLIGEDVSLRTVLNAKEPLVMADPGHIDQVIVNLAVNARDAMPHGGVLTIETQTIVLEEAYADRQLDVAPGAYVLLEVSDTGIGMDSETLGHIFEPFFTTKEDGKGTGLGLATIYGIVKQAAGHITVYSEPGRGTTFRIYLPRCGAVEEEVATTVGPATGSTGGRTVLLVEDERAVRVAVRKSLERGGHVVLECAGPTEAVHTTEAHTGAIHLLLTDVVMPGTTGPELAREIQALRPGIKVLFMSGYTGEAALHAGLLNTGAAFVQKPMTPDQLLRRVRDVLDREE